MASDIKHTERVTVWFTEREYLDLCRMADANDRKPGELSRVIVRRFMYGNVGADPIEFNVANRADAVRGTEGGGA